MVIAISPTEVVNL